MEMTDEKRNKIIVAITIILIVLITVGTAMLVGKVL